MHPKFGSARMYPCGAHATKGDSVVAIGLPGADSSSLVTKIIKHKTIVDLANDLYGRMPVVWGRYFGGPNEYLHRQENQLLRDNNIRVLPLAQQTTRVAGSLSDGSMDATSNAEDVINTFEAAYLASLGGQVLMFLDVEGMPEKGSPSLSAAYYQGWAQNLVAHSRAFSGNAVTLLPCIYARAADSDTWDALLSALSNGATCNGAWIARWTTQAGGCLALPDFNPAGHWHIPNQVRVLLWQYSNDCHGSDGFDCNEINPDPTIQAAVLNGSVLPPPVLMA
jgi:hypothetical protein